MSQHMNQHMNQHTWTPVTKQNCQQIAGPFYHGSKVQLRVGDLLLAGQPSNFEEGRTSNHIYFASQLEPAIWGAELAMALAGLAGRGYIYIVQPTGAFEDDPNLTNKKFPGNPTQSYRSTEPVKVIGMLENWEGHSPEMVQGMLNSLTKLKSQGLAIIED